MYSFSIFFIVKASILKKLQQEPIRRKANNLHLVRLRARYTLGPSTEVKSKERTRIPQSLQVIPIIIVMIIMIIIITKWKGSP
jgi:hypothetical protein